MNASILLNISKNNSGLKGLIKLKQPCNSIYIYIYIYIYTYTHIYIYIYKLDAEIKVTKQFRNQRA